MFYGDVFKALNKARVKYVVAGGVAVVLHGYLRNTSDLDLIVFLEEKNLERFFNALTKIGYYPKVAVTKEQFIKKKTRDKWINENRTIVVSFYHDTDPFKVIDMFIKEPPSFAKLYRDRIKIKSNNIATPIISINHLRNLQRKNNETWGHLEHTLTKTTCAMRLKWLEQADQFTRAARKAKIVKK